MFSTELGFTLEAAFREASSRHHAYFTVEHLLYALLFEASILEAFDAIQVDAATIRGNIEDYFDEEVEHLPAGGAGEPIQTPAIRRVLERSVLRKRTSGQEMVTPRDVLISLIDEPETHAAFFLAEHGVKKLDLLEYFSHGTTSHSSERIDEEYSEESAERPSRMIDRFLEDLTERARKGLLDPVIGRKAEVARALRILSRRQKNNPLLVGESGVGKTAIAHALAHAVVSDQSLPQVLRSMPIYSLNVGALIAGTKFRGDLEERIKTLLSELKKKGDVILLIDEIHTILGSGSTSGSSLDAASLLKPALNEGWLRCIGITTHEDYKKNFKRDQGFARRFSVIDVAEPSLDEAVAILEGLVPLYESHHKVTYARAAIRAAVELSAIHINERFLPDKAIDVIDEAGARNAFLSQAKRRRTISVREIEEVISSIAKVPVARKANDKGEVIRGLQERISGQVFGQEAAVSTVVRAIKRGWAHLKAPNLPVGSFLFAGPTGVGKTELAKTLARELGIHFHRFDMSEYMEKHAVARLIGAPPGYVGHEEGGLLVDYVRRHPHSVVLFDEIEKAHPDVFNILLQIMDDARVTDSQGRQADFRHVVIILTTNAGSEKSGGIGFGEGTAVGVKEDAIKRLFKPEFRNRLDETVYFNPLPPTVIEDVARKFLDELKSQLVAQNVSLEVSAEAVRAISSKGFDPLLGARPMRRYIQRELKDRLADELLFGIVAKGGSVRVDYRDNDFSFDFMPAGKDK
jgi:ATP-dependent Clp protease ATP-binding subunit ClpA